MRPAVQAAAFLVHAPNATAVRLFQAMATQWNMVTLTTLEHARIIRTGLRYEVLDVMARGLGLGSVATDDFQRIRYMEAEALLAWSEVQA